MTSTITALLRRLDPAQDLAIEYDHQYGDWLLTDDDGLYVVARLETRQAALQAWIATRRRYRTIGYVCNHLLGLCNLLVGQLERALWRR